MKIKILISILLISVVFPISAIGQIDFNLPKPGLTPDSPFYFFDTIGKKISLLFTFSLENKAKKALQYAEEKLAEAEMMVEKNNPKALEKATQKYQEFVDLTNQKTEEAKEKGKDVEEILATIAEATAKHQIVLEDILQKVPEQAEQGIQTAIEKSKTGQQQALQVISKEKKIEVLNNIIQFKEEIKKEQEATKQKQEQASQKAELGVKEAEQKIGQAEATAEKLQKEAEATKDKNERAKLMAEAEKSRLEAEKAKTETEKLRKELEAAQKSALKTQEAVQQPKTEEQKQILTPSIANVSPNQILNNIQNYLTIGGSNFQKDAEVIIGGINFGAGNVIDNKTITITISSGVLSPNTYSVQVVNPDGKTDILYNSLTVVKPQPSAPSASTELTTEDIFAKVAPAVVQIYNDRGQGCPCSGSGMIIDSMGYILTNWHVIEGDPTVEVKLKDGSLLDGSVIGWNEAKDLAVVKISSSNLSYINWGNSDIVRQGEKVVVLGHPLGLSGVVISEGIITARQETEGGSLLQTNASTQPGSSGGPWVNTKGEVIGIHLAGLGPKIYGFKIDIGYNFGIPVNTAKSIISDLKAGAKASIPKQTPTPEPQPEPTGPGSLTISLSPGSPSPATYSLGTTNYTFAKFNLVASGEDIIVSQANVTFSTAIADNITILATAADVNNIKIYDGNILLATDPTISSGRAEFGVNLTIAKNTTKTLTVTGDIPVGSIANYLRAQIREPGDIAIIGKNSGQILVAQAASWPVLGNLMTKGIPTITVKAATTPVAQTYLKNTAGAHVATLYFTASPDEDVKIIAIKIAGDITNTFTAAGHGNLHQKIGSIKLFDGSTQIGNVSAFTNGTDYAYTELTGLSLVIARGTTKAIDIKLDILDSNDSPYYFGIVANTHISAVGLSSGQPAAVSGTFPIASQAMTFSPAGSLSIALDSNSPASAQVVAGSTGVEFTRIKFAATMEDISIIKIKVTLTDGSATNFVKVSLYDGTTWKADAFIGADEANKAIFNFPSGSEIIISKSVPKVLIIKAELADHTKIISGSALALGIASPADVTSQGRSSGNFVVATGVATVGNPMYVYRTKPTVKLASSGSPSGGGSPSTNETVFKFDVAAPNTGFDLNINTIKFTISSNSTSAAQTLDDGVWYLYKSTDLTTTIGSATPFISGTTIAYGYLAIYPTSGFTVGSNSATTYVLKGYTTGMNVGSGGETLTVGIGEGDFYWDDGSGINDNKHVLNLPVWGGTSIY